LADQLLFSSYHLAWFFLFALGVFGVVALAANMIMKGPRAAIQEVGNSLRERGWQVMAALAVLGVSLLPFVRTYAPLIRDQAARSFDLVLEFAPRLRDVVNVSANNYVWSPLLGGLGYDFGNRETQMGSPILVLLLFGLTAFILAWRLRKMGWSRLSSRQRFMLSTVTAVVLLPSAKWTGLTVVLHLQRQVHSASGA
jgi:hypothetical protein